MERMLLWQNIESIEACSHTCSYLIKRQIDLEVPEYCTAIEVLYSEYYHFCAQKREYIVDMSTFGKTLKNWGLNARDVDSS